MEIGLRQVLVAEGATDDVRQLSPDVRAYAERIFYLPALVLVIGLYKAAARLRRLKAVSEVVNIDGTSRVLFRLFAQNCKELAGFTGASDVVRALILHNAASASASQNGCTGEQATLNVQARDLLLRVPAEDRDDDWQCVYEKVMCGLYEDQLSGIVLDESDYRGIINSMHSHGSKDTAGRRAFLAQHFRAQGRHNEALAVLELVEGDTFSASNQRERALDMLVKLRTSLRA